MIPLPDAQAEVVVACHPQTPRLTGLDTVVGLVLAEPVAAAEGRQLFACNRGPRSRPLNRWTQSNFIFTVKENTQEENKQ